MDTGELTNFPETVAPAAVITYSLVSILGTLAAALFMGRKP